MTRRTNPYPGNLGVVEEATLADLLLADGNPLNNINLLADPTTSLAVITKDGYASLTQCAQPRTARARASPPIGAARTSQAHAAADMVGS
jgi:hypothetical protein